MVGALGTSESSIVDTSSMSYKNRRGQNVTFRIIELNTEQSLELLLFFNIFLNFFIYTYMNTCGLDC